MEFLIGRSRPPSPPRRPTIRRTVLRIGDDKGFPKRGQQVTVHYTAALAKTEEVFDCTRARDAPFRFRAGLGSTIPAFDAVLQMQTREHVLLEVPWELAYGERGLPGLVPPKTDILLDIELLRIE